MSSSLDFIKTRTDDMPPRTNSKAAAGRERQKEQETKKKAEEDRRKQEVEDKEWQKGSNIKGQSRADEAGTLTLYIVLVCCWDDEEPMSSSDIFSLSLSQRPRQMRWLVKNEKRKNCYDKKKPTT